MSVPIRELDPAKQIDIATLAREYAPEFVTPTFPLEIQPVSIREIIVQFTAPCFYATRISGATLAVVSDGGGIQVTPFEIQGQYPVNERHATGGVIIGFNGQDRVVALAGEQPFYSGLAQDKFEGVVPTMRLLKVDEHDENVLVYPIIAPEQYVLQNEHSGEHGNFHWGLELYKDQSHVRIDNHGATILITREE